MNVRSNHCSPPASEEVEISLFGPGFGECSAIHVGNGRWVVIDSCITDETRRPAVLQYFEEIGVDPATAISDIVVSHPDNDHIGGIATVFDAAKRSRLVVSGAFTSRDMLFGAALYSQADPSSLTRATSELTKLFSIAQSRNVRPIFAVQDRILSQDGYATVSALAPSDGKIQQLLKTLVIPKKFDDKLKPQGLSPNPASVVVHLECPNCVAIFGGDLEESPGLGWTDVMENSALFKRSAAPMIFKVPHHGSPNADHPALWAHFGGAVIAIMTSFNSGPQPRPAPDDVRRILNYTNSAYVCSSRYGGKPKKDHEVDKHLKLIGIKRRRRFSRDGHIRIRIAANKQPSVELFGAATDLARLHDAA